MLRQHCLHDLLHRAIDAAHDRQLIHDGFAHPQDQPANKAGRQRADQGDRDQQQCEANTGYGERQIGLRIVAHGNQRHDLLVDEVDQQPGKIDGQPDGGRNQHTGEEIGAQPAGHRQAKAALLARRGLFLAGSWAGL